MRHKLLILLSLFVLLIVAACANQVEEEPNLDDLFPEGELQFPEVDRSELGADKIVAVYEGGEVTGEEFATFLAVQAFINPNAPVNDSEYRMESINYYILEKTISVLIEDSTWADEQTEEVWEQFTTFYDNGVLESAYAALQITEEDIREVFHRYFLTDDYFRQQVAEEDVQAFYDENIDLMTTADVRHILISTHELEDGELVEVRSEEEAQDIADDLYNQLQEGADFAALAEEYTEDEGSKANGGLYANAPVSNWVPEFKDAALEQEIDEIGEPVQTMYGFHIIRVEDRETITLEEIREKIVGELSFDLLFEHLHDTLLDTITEVNLS